MTCSKIADIFFYTINLLFMHSYRQWLANGGTVGFCWRYILYQTHYHQYKIYIPKRYGFHFNGCMYIINKHQWCHSSIAYLCLFIYLYLYLFIHLFILYFYISADVNAGQNWLWGYQFKLQIKSLWYSPQRKGTDVINSKLQGGETFTNCETYHWEAFLKAPGVFPKLTQWLKYELNEVGSRRHTGYCKPKFISTFYHLT